MPRKYILDMTEIEARTFFLKSESYCNIPLPDYINLDAIIRNAESIIGKSQLSDIQYSAKQKKDGPNLNITLLKEIMDANLRIMANKDGAYSWRPFTLIHPVLYVDFINTLTERENWEKIKTRFSEFQKDDRIICVSIPVESTSARNDASEQILSWWENLEQAHIKLALDFNYCIHTDITDCYPSIYTHTIAWALHGKEWAKQNRKEGLGNTIDNKIQSLQGRQTNGIPQGTVLMDLIAELVLGYADTRLLASADSESLSGFKILRYRDDYRIFANKKDTAERLMKLLSEVLLELNLKINSKKTFLSDDLILDAIKPDKLYWNTKNAAMIEYNNSFRRIDNKFTLTKKRFYKLNLQKHLIEIKMLGDKYPNCGQLVKALNDFYENRISILDPQNNQISDNEQLISILTSIMVKNPRTVQSCVAILHTLLKFVDDKNKVDIIINSILKKFDDLPNADLVEIWIQNISVRSDRTKVYKNLLSKKIAGDNTMLWNSDWLKPEKRINEILLIDEVKISELQPKYTLNDFNLDSD